jgi:hypothetical protein
MRRLYGRQFPYLYLLLEGWGYAMLHENNLA